MERFYLEIPTIKRKQEALDYLKENTEHHSDLNGTGGMERCLEEITYKEWLLELRNKENIEYVNNNNICLSKTFFMIREYDNKIIGMVNIRYNISKDKLETWASHVGYGIRPTERRKGYAKIALYLSLLELQKLGEENALLICDIDNIASNKTILALGGKLKKTEPYSIDNIMTNYYWININDSIEKYSKYYKKYTINI